MARQNASLAPLEDANTVLPPQEISTAQRIWLTELQATKFWDAGRCESGIPRPSVDCYYFLMQLLSYAELRELGLSPKAVVGQHLWLLADIGTHGQQLTDVWCQVSADQFRHVARAPGWGLFAEENEGHLVYGLPGGLRISPTGECSGAVAEEPAGFRVGSTWCRVAWRSGQLIERLDGTELYRSPSSDRSQFVQVGDTLWSLSQREEQLDILSPDGVQSYKVEMLPNDHRNCAVSRGGLVFRGRSDLAGAGLLRLNDQGELEFLANCEFSIDVDPTLLASEHAIAWLETDRVERNGKEVKRHRVCVVHPQGGEVQTVHTSEGLVELLALAGQILCFSELARVETPKDGVTLVTQAPGPLIVMTLPELMASAVSSPWVATQLSDLPMSDEAVRLLRTMGLHVTKDVWSGGVSTIRKQMKDAGKPKLCTEFDYAMQLAQWNIDSATQANPLPPAILAPLSTLPLPAKLVAVLRDQLGLATIADLVQQAPYKFRGVPSLDEAAMEQIESAVAAGGWKLGLRLTDLASTS